MTRLEQMQKAAEDGGQTTTDVEAIKIILENQSGAHTRMLEYAVMNPVYAETQRLDCEAFDIAIAALRDAAEREKGCEHCLTLYEDGESWENGEPHELRIDGQSLLSYGSDGWEGEQVQFCPWCGRKLEATNA